MDQLKIGKFIAENRHALSLTQAQLAEQLGVSDKSVSKWERGVCLPDASLYFPLCDALGVTVNELFAGERLKPESVERSAENTIVTLAADSDQREKRLVRLKAMFWTALVLITVIIGLGIHFPAQTLFILRIVYIFLILLLFFAACYLLLWLFSGRGKQGAEDRAMGGFLNKLAFLKAGTSINVMNHFRFR